MFTERWRAARVGPSGTAGSSNAASLRSRHDARTSSNRANYRVACETSERIVRTIGDPDTSVSINGEGRNVRWAMLAVIEKAARHAGHADIIREQIDGQTGR